MKNNLFEIGAKFEDTWVSDNKQKTQAKSSTQIKLPQKHQLHLSKEKRRGKTVSIVKPFYLTTNDLKALLQTLKKKLGTGGTIRENALEFQGDIPKILRTQLETLGYRFKK